MRANAIPVLLYPPDASWTKGHTAKNVSCVYNRTIDTNLDCWNGWHVSKWMIKVDRDRKLGPNVINTAARIYITKENALIP